MSFSYYFMLDGYRILSSTDFPTTEPDLFSLTNMVPPKIGCLFSEKEKDVTAYSNSKHRVFRYCSTAGKILRRLSIFGFTPGKAYRNFENCKNLAIKEETDDEGYYLGDPILQQITVERWRACMIELLHTKKHTISVENAADPNTDMHEYMFMHNKFVFGFPAEDFRDALAAILSLVDEETEVALDYSELVYGECYSETDNVAQIAQQHIRRPRNNVEHIIIMTEGKFDAFVLQQSLQLLYPDMVQYFSFLDFDESRTAGGAGRLTSYVKALIGAGITDRIVAIYDNDSAALDAMKQLENLSEIPENIQYMAYPHYDFLTNYPTIGPTGKQFVDINRLAGSIELYLGKDVLEMESGYVPVQWTGYIQSVRQYQGEILEKNSIQKRFEEKLKACLCDKDSIHTYDWEGIQLVWEGIFAICAG